MPGPSLVYSLRSEGAMRQLLKRERQRQVGLVKTNEFKIVEDKTHIAWFTSTRDAIDNKYFLTDFFVS